jgi:hypothetical protein
LIEITYGDLQQTSVPILLIKSDGVNRGNPYASGYAIGFDERKSETLHFASIKEI